MRLFWGEPIAVRQDGLDSMRSQPGRRSMRLEYPRIRGALVFRPLHSRKRVEPHARPLARDRCVTLVERARIPLVGDRRCRAHRSIAPGRKNSCTFTSAMSSSQNKCVRTFRGILASRVIRHLARDCEHSVQAHEVAYTALASRSARRRVRHRRHFRSNASSAMTRARSCLVQSRAPLSDC